MPREHGAWGVLLIPFATAAGVSGVCDIKMALLLVSVLCFYVARTSFLKKNWKWTAILLAVSAACTVPLLVVWRLWWLAAFGSLAAPLAFRKTDHSVAMQLVSVGGLTLTGPAAWYAGTGHLDTQAFLLWLFNAFYFGGGVFYVKMHVAAAIRRRSIIHARDRLALGAATVWCYAGMASVLAAIAAAGWIPWAVLLAYTPVLARSVVGVWRISPSPRIRRLGWTEVAYSIVFAGLLVVLLRLSGWGAA